jgi:hypothetical protein
VSRVPRYLRCASTCYELLKPPSTAPVRTRPRNGESDEAYEAPFCQSRGRCGNGTGPPVRSSPRHLTARTARFLPRHTTERQRLRFIPPPSRRRAAPVAYQANASRHPPSDTPCRKPSHQHNTASVIERTYPHSFLPNSQRLQRECRDLPQDSGPGKAGCCFVGQDQRRRWEPNQGAHPSCRQTTRDNASDSGRLVELSNTLDDLASECSASMACARILAGQGGRQSQGQLQR